MDDKRFAEVVKGLEEAVEWCRKRGLEFYAVNKNFPEEIIEDDNCYGKPRNKRRKTRETTIFYSNTFDF